MRFKQDLLGKEDLRGKSQVQDEEYIDECVKALKLYAKFINETNTKGDELTDEDKADLNSA